MATGTAARGAPGNLQPAGEVLHIEAPELPQDALLRVFGNLSCLDLASAACVCRHWRQAACAEELWLALLCTELGVSHKPAWWQQPCHKLLRECLVDPLCSSLSLEARFAATTQAIAAAGGWALRLHLLQRTLLQPPQPPLNCCLRTTQGPGAGVRVQVSHSLNSTITVSISQPGPDSSSSSSSTAAEIPCAPTTPPPPPPPDYSPPPPQAPPNALPDFQTHRRLSATRLTPAQLAVQAGVASPALPRRLGRPPGTVLLRSHEAVPSALDSTRQGLWLRFNLPAWAAAPAPSPGAGAGLQAGAGAALGLGPGLALGPGAITWMELTLVAATPVTSCSTVPAWLPIIQVPNFQLPANDLEMLRQSHREGIYVYKDGMEQLHAVAYVHYEQLLPLTHPHIAIPQVLHLPLRPRPLVPPLSRSPLPQPSPESSQHLNRPIPQECGAPLASPDPPDFADQASISKAVPGDSRTAHGSPGGGEVPPAGAEGEGGGQGQGQGQGGRCAPSPHQGHSFPPSPFQPPELLLLMMDLIQLGQSHSRRSVMVTLQLKQLTRSQQRLNPSCRPASCASDPSAPEGCPDPSGGRGVVVGGGWDDCPEFVYEAQPWSPPLPAPHLTPASPSLAAALPCVCPLPSDAELADAAQWVKAPLLAPATPPPPHHASPAPLGDRTPPRTPPLLASNTAAAASAAPAGPPGSSAGSSGLHPAGGVQALLTPPGRPTCPCPPMTRWGPLPYARAGARRWHCMQPCLADALLCLSQPASAWRQELAVQHATLPGQHATLPGQHATLPGQHTTLPGQHATLPASMPLTAAHLIRHEVAMALWGRGVESGKGEGEAGHTPGMQVTLPRAMQGRQSGEGQEEAKSPASAPAPTALPAPTSPAFPALQLGSSSRGEDTPDWMEGGQATGPCDPMACLHRALLRDGMMDFALFYLPTNSSQSLAYKPGSPECTHPHGAAVAVQHALGSCEVLGGDASRAAAISKATGSAAAGAPAARSSRPCPPLLPAHELQPGQLLIGRCGVEFWSRSESLEFRAAGPAQRGPPSQGPASQPDVTEPAVADIAVFDAHFLVDGVDQELWGNKLEVRVALSSQNNAPGTTRAGDGSGHYLPKRLVESGVPPDMELIRLTLTRASALRLWGVA